MPHELRALERDSQLSREDWITEFVNAIVREMCRGLERMVAVSAAREEWPQMHGANPYLAAQEWVSKHAHG